jgi:hypothetical protein
VTTLNPADKKNSNVVLSNGNLTVTGNDASNNWVRSTTAKTDKVYVEVTHTTVANSCFGIADLSALTFPGSNAKSFGLYSNGYGSINGAFPDWLTPYVSGNVAGMAIDFTAKLVWCRVGAGNWNGSPTANPAAGIGGFSIADYTGAANYFVSSGGTGSVATVNFGATAFANAAPAGFGAWDPGLLGINFPSSPVTGQIFTPPGGPTWQWNFEGKWRRNPGTATPFNRVGNPSMQISQQNGNASSTAVGFYAADQWPMSKVQATGTCAVARVQSITPRGSPNRLRMAVTVAQTTLAAGDYMGFYHRIEGNRIADLRWGTASALQAVLRFGFRAPAGTWAFSFRSGDTATAPRAYSIPIVVPAGKANQDVEYTFVIPGPTSGGFPNDNTCGLELWFTPAAGTNYAVGADLTWRTASTIGVAGQSNGFSSTSNVFEVFDVGLYADPLLTGVAPEFQQPLYEDDLFDCLRYWYPAFGLRGSASGNNWGPAQETHHVPMRISPAYAIVGTPLMNDLTTVVAITTISATGAYLKPTDQSIELGLYQSGTSFIITRSLIHHWDSDANYIAVSARM